METLTRGQRRAILFAFESELKDFGKLDKEARQVVRKLLKCPKLKAENKNLAEYVKPDRARKLIQ